MTNINISLPESMKAYVEEQAAKGGYGTVDEYFLELIRQDQKQKAHKKLESLLIEGLESEPSTPMNAQDWQDIRQAVRDRISDRNQGLTNG